MLHSFGAAKEDLFKIAKKNILEKYPFSLFPMLFGFYGIVGNVYNKDWEETGKCHILRYDFKAEETENFSVQGELYRMCGGSGNDALCVDMHYHIYRIDGDTGQMEKINGVFGFANMPVLFRPIFDNQVART